MNVIDGIDLVNYLKTKSFKSKMSPVSDAPIFLLLSNLQ